MLCWPYLYEIWSVGGVLCLHHSHILFLSYFQAMKYQSSNPHVQCTWPQGRNSPTMEQWNASKDCHISALRQENRHSRNGPFGHSRSECPLVPQQWCQPTNMLYSNIFNPNVSQHISSTITHRINSNCLNFLSVMTNPHPFNIPLIRIPIADYTTTHSSFIHQENPCCKENPHQVGCWFCVGWICVW